MTVIPRHAPWELSGSCLSYRFWQCLINVEMAKPVSEGLWQEAQADAWDYLRGPNWDGFPEIVSHG